MCACLRPSSLTYVICYFYLIMCGFYSCHLSNDQLQCQFKSVDGCRTVVCDFLYHFLSSPPPKKEHQLNTYKKQSSLWLYVVFFTLISAAEQICFYRWVIVMDTGLCTGSITHHCRQFHVILMMVNSWC